MDDKVKAKTVLAASTSPQFGEDYLDQVAKEQRKVARHEETKKRLTKQTEVNKELRADGYYSSLQQISKTPADWRERWADMVVVLGADGKRRLDIAALALPAAAVASALGARFGEAYGTLSKNRFSGQIPLVARKSTDPSIKRIIDRINSWGLDVAMPDVKPEGRAKVAKLRMSQLIDHLQGIPTERPNMTRIQETVEYFPTYVMLAGRKWFWYSETYQMKAKVSRTGYLRPAHGQGKPLSIDILMLLTKDSFEDILRKSGMESEIASTKISSEEST
ncbi:hypothetical protein AX768_23800 [Burkholderia sp. PAMC 28687]|uniref:hypothetical protein n=1 Tax=Burkholderia sp. PAMC 28687 TaxID=1795874 RepID=UPI00078078C6|nr:hypothetical protein [Burkholderia sp. PAMC 28687]AMM17261.1 hypothetical protein AX768_23800 [Burkholderia sp. PAMC 28687]